MKPDNERRDLELQLELADSVIVLYWNRACMASDPSKRVEYLAQYLRFRS